jgi:hypothetical protein
MDSNCVADRSRARRNWYHSHFDLRIANSHQPGLVKSPVSTTALQVVTRVIQVWMIWFCFPESTASSHAYAALVLAWSIADTIRYAYLAANLWGAAPKWLIWLRYTMFYPLYPIGISAEWWLLYRAIEPAGRISSVIPPIFWGCLMLYVPGKYRRQSCARVGVDEDAQDHGRCTRI